VLAATMSFQVELHGVEVVLVDLNPHPIGLVAFGAQRIYPVGKAWLIKNKVLPLQHESYPTAACHPSRCADRQF
jgi:hypothetical protein